jgi:hypothetical protein
VKIKMMIAGLGSLLIATSAFANYSKSYCGGSEYLGNAGSKYPHLHCAKDHFTFSKTSSNHKNLNGLGGKKCVGPIDEILADIHNGTYKLADSAAVVTALTAFKTAGCP